MNTANAMSQQPSASDLTGSLFRRSSERNNAGVLADIYRDDTNIAIWKRELSDELLSSVDAFINTSILKKAVLAVTAKDTTFIETSVQSV